MGTTQRVFFLLAFPSKLLTQLMTPHLLVILLTIKKINVHPSTSATQDSWNEHRCIFSPLCIAITVSIPVISLLHSKRLCFFDHFQHEIAMCNRSRKGTLSDLAAEFFRVKAMKNVGNTSQPKRNKWNDRINYQHNLTSHNRP